MVMLHEEGLQARWARHAAMHQKLKSGLESLGLSFVVPEAARLPQLNAVTIPQGVDDGATRRALLDQFGLEIGGGLGALAGKVWRIGLMGSACTARNVQLCCAALKAVLGR